MTRAFLFLLACGLKNRVLLRLNRLRNPKYLISILAGLAYLYFVFLYPSHLNESQLPRNPLTPEAGLFGIAETGFASLLLAAVLFQCFFVGGRTVVFNEAEIQLLFPAPVSRRALLHYHMAKAQIGILFGALISVLIFGRRIFLLHAGFLFGGLWIVYSFLYLCRIAVILGKRTFEEHGAPGWKIRSWMLGFLFVAGSSIVFWTKRFAPALPRQDSFAPADLSAWLLNISGSGPAYCLLLPFKLIVRPVFAIELSQFALSLIPAFFILALVYGWIQHGKADLGGDVSGRDGVDARRLTGRPGRITKQMRGGLSRRPPFRLAPEGAPSMAIYWKNLILASGLNARQILPGLAAIAAISVLIKYASGEPLPMIIGSIAAALAGFLTLLGPVLFREDLRTDLKNIDMLKTYPIPGWGIVLGETLGPATVLTILEWALALVAVLMLPGVDAIPWKAHERVFIGFGAALLLPFISFLGILIQNATVLILPGWVQLGREHARGVEAMGQRLISSIATVLFLLIAVLPAALLFSAVFFAGYRIMGLAIMPFASLGAALALFLVAGVGIFWLGRLFDKLDASDL